MRDDTIPPMASPTRALVLALAGAIAVAAAALHASPAVADEGHAYALEATLDPDTHTVRGVARITWRNEATTPADELYLHLYLNAFESEDTVFMRGSGGSLRGVVADGRGRIELEALETEDGASLLEAADDELVPDDHTQLRVPLETPVAPGASLVLVARFTSHLPPVFARSGYHGSFHMVAQWFPKLARREPDGTWATFPYHPHGEFYADFARYELTVTVPDGFVVGATGALVEERHEARHVVRRFVADRVHDAAFVAWDRFDEQTFEGEGVTVRVLHPEGYEPAVRRHRFMTERGLARFGRLFGAYPYAHLTVVVPPRGAEGAAGMEYPTLFLTAGPWFDMSAFRIGLQEDVTAHELAHQWFQGIIATNEVRHPMLDEGLAEWATADLVRATFGERASLTSFPRPVSYFDAMRLLDFRGDPVTPPPGLPAHAYAASEYGRSVYVRTTLVLETIARVWGRPRLERALGVYAREQRFAHPTPDALFDAFDRTYHRGFSRSVLAPALREGAHAEMQLDSLRSRKRGDHHVTELDATRIGTLALPIAVELTDEAGDRVRLPWRPAERRLALTHESTRRIVSATLDPDGHVLLDPSIADNTRGARGRESLFGNVLHHVAQLLVTVGP